MADPYGYFFTPETGAEEDYFTPEVGAPAVSMPGGGIGPVTPIDEESRLDMEIAAARQRGDHIEAGRLIRKKVILKGGKTGPEAYKPPEPTSQQLPGGLASMAGLQQQQQQPINPLLTMTPEQLAKPIPMGTTQSSQWQSGVKSMPGMLGAIKSISQREKEAIDAQTRVDEARSGAMAAESDAVRLHMRLEDFRLQEKQAELAKQIKAHDAQMAKVRAEVDEASNFDAGRWWSSQDVGQKAGWVLAAALQGIAMGISGRGGANQVIAAMEQRIDRDLQVQRANYQRKREKLSDLSGGYALLRQKGLDDTQASIQLKQGLLERYKMRIMEIEENTKSQAVRANGERLKIAIDKRDVELANAAYQAAQPRSTGSSTKQMMPLGQVLAQQMKGQKPLPAPKQEVRGKLAGIWAVRKDLAHFMHEYKKLNVPGVTKFAGRDADAVAELRKRLIDKVASSSVMGQLSTEQLKLFHKALGGDWNTDGEVKYRVGLLASEFKNVADSLLDAEEAYSKVTPLRAGEAKSQALLKSLVGGGH